jgi:outer membrane protein assembly factor BamD
VTPQPSASAQLLKPFFVVVLLVVLITLPTACSSKPKPGPGGQAVSGTDEQIFIGDTIEKNYDPNVIMKRAEAFFDKDEVPEAIIEYQHFLDLHRVHTLAPYAQYKLGESHFKMFKTIDRDPEPVYKALDGFQRLLKEYPGSRYEDEALDKIRECNDRIAQMHFFVGQFYFRREAYLAAARRFEAILKDYPEMDVASDALYYLALTYKEIGANDWAHENLVTLAARYPNNRHQEESRTLLAQLETELKAGGTAVASAGGSSSNGSSSFDGSGSSSTASLRKPGGATATLQPASSEVPPKGMFCRLGLWC